MAKDMIYDQKAREALLRGVNTLADAVKGDSRTQRKKVIL